MSSKISIPPQLVVFSQPFLALLRSSLCLGQYLQIPPILRKTNISLNQNIYEKPINIYRTHKEQAYIIII